MPPWCDRRPWCRNSAGRRSHHGGILQNCFQVIQGLGCLGAHVPRMERVSLGVNGHLSRAIEDTPRVADLVRLDKPVLVLPPPRVDDPPFHNASFLPLRTGGLTLSTANHASNKGIENPLGISSHELLRNPLL